MKKSVPGRRQSVCRTLRQEHACHIEGTVKKLLSLGWSEKGGGGMRSEREQKRDHADP